MKRKIELILKVLIILAIVAWITIIFIDFFRTKSEKNPMFCVSEKTVKYNDGETYECVGLGYKMYRYNRTCGGIQFGPFFMKELTIEELCQHK